jgi:hypothetical protein
VPRSGIGLNELLGAETTRENNGPEELARPPEDRGTGRAPEPVKTRPPKPHDLGRDWLRDHAPATVSEIWKRDGCDA